MALKNARQFDELKENLKALGFLKWNDLKVFTDWGLPQTKEDRQMVATRILIAAIRP